MLPKLRSRMPSLIDEFFENDVLTDFFGGRSTSIPAANITEQDKEYKIEVAAPGLQKEDFEINVENDVLIVSSKKEEEKEEKEKNYMRREFSYQTFSRSFALPNMADSDKIKASHKDGVLTINIPKKEEAWKKPAKKVAIE